MTGLVYINDHWTLLGDTTDVWAEMTLDGQRKRREKMSKESLKSCSGKNGRLRKREREKYLFDNILSRQKELNYSL